MFILPIFLLGITHIVNSSEKGIRLEWALGRTHPVAKLLNAGSEQDLYCSVDDKNHNIPVLLQCPMYQGICMENCNPHGENLHISCTNISYQNTIIYRYRIKVFKSYEGLWNCQHKSSVSRNVQLTVSNKPYISSFVANPNPVWKNTPVNITCQVLPTSGLNGIQLSRISNENVTSIIQNDQATSGNQYVESIIIPFATPGRDDKIQCTVYTVNGIITTKLLNINIFYSPKSLALTSSSSDESFVVGFLISFHCSADGGNPRPSLVLYRQRLDEGPERLKDNSILLSKFDNGAKFYCKNENIGIIIKELKSNEIKIKVKYPPDNIQLTEEPQGNLRESQIQSFVCLSKGGSEPPSRIKWSMTDPFGKKVLNLDLERIIERTETSENVSKTLKDSIRITILRNLNGYTVSCSIIYQKKISLIEKKLIKVLFSPNVIALNSDPIGPILNGNSVVLTCSTGTANPAAKVQWYKVKPGIKSEDITSYSNMDLVPDNFSGVAISSTLSIHDVTKGDHGTVYKCIVSHAYISSEIVKEFFLNILFPPVIQIYSYPQPTDEGDQVFLHCRTSGGNPNNFSLYQFQWRFCAVNHTYQLPSNADFYNQPSSDIRKYCSHNSQISSFQQSPTLNLTSVSSQERGWYLCLVHSPGGSAIGYSFLNIYFAPILVRRSTERLYVKTASEVTLQFEVVSNPLDIEVKWFFMPQQRTPLISPGDQLDDSNVQPSSSMKRPIIMRPYGRFESIVFDNYTVSLVVRSITHHDYGSYYCEVSNHRGKKMIQFQLYPSNDITIPEMSINIQFNGRTVTVHYEPPSPGHFTHLILRICSLEDAGNCKDMHISNPSSGKASTTLHRSPNSFSYRILVYNGSSLLQITNSIQKSIALQSGHWVEMSFEMMVAVIIGVAGIFCLVFIALLTLIFLKCRQKKSKADVFVESNSVATVNSHRRQDYFLLNSSANTTLLKNGCHCFSNYPLELRSENGSDHSAPSQGVYHPMMMTRKLRDNGEMSSIHSGGSCQNPDVVLTERTSIGSGNIQPFNGTPQFNSLGGNTPTKVTFLSGRLHSNDNQRQDVNLPEEFILPQNMVYAAVDDGTIQTRLIPITANNLHSEYPLYFQMNTQPVSKAYDQNAQPLYSMSHPECIKPPENYRENSSSTNTDSNQYPGTKDPSVFDVTNAPGDFRNGETSQT